MRVYYSPGFLPFLCTAVHVQYLSSLLPHLLFFSFFMYFLFLVFHSAYWGRHLTKRGSKGVRMRQEKRYLHELPKIEMGDILAK